MQPGEATVAVVGAGLAGLAAAFRLRQRGFRVVVLERENQPGGRAASGRQDGYCLEWAGAALSDADANLLAWIDAAGARDALLPLRPMLECQVRGDRTEPLGGNAWSAAARTPGVRWRDALRLVRLPRLMRRYAEHLSPGEPERAAALDDRSLADFGRLYFGPSVLERWLAPSVTSVSLDDEAETSRALFLRRQHAYANARLGLPRGPLGELAAAAASQLDVRLGHEVSSVDAPPDGKCLVVARSNGRRPEDLQWGVDAVVLAVPAPDALRLAHSALEPAERDGLGAVRYTPALSLALALRRPLSAHPQHIRVPHAEGAPIETVTLEPGVRGGRAPEGKGLATLRATGAFSEANLSAPEESVEKSLLDALERFLPGARGAIEFSVPMRLARALPRFRVGRYGEIERFERVQRDRCQQGRRLYFAGDYLMAPSFEGAVSSGLRAASAVETDLL